MKIAGLGKVGRKKLAEVIRGTKGTISVAETATILGIPRSDAAKMLSRWAGKGWLSRVYRGLYITVPLEAETADIPMEDPWIVAERIYAPCYIGGWSAAEYWELTEQVFRTIVVMTTQKPRNRAPTIKGVPFLIRTVSERTMFGLKPAWRGQIRVSISDPSRTIIDMLSDPGLGGGIRSTADMLADYLRSEKKDTQLLVEYAKRLANGAVFKRLGFLLERLAPNEQVVIDTCRSELTKGNAKLDPALSADKLVTRWRLWIPKGWLKEN
jgi:predicted transcriptional regulator of viral defense system